MKFIPRNFTVYAEIFNSYSDYINRNNFSLKGIHNFKDLNYEYFVSYDSPMNCSFLRICNSTNKVEGDSSGKQYQIEDKKTINNRTLLEIYNSYEQTI